MSNYSYANSTHTHALTPLERIYTHACTHTHTHKHSRMKNVYALQGDLDKVVFAVEVEPGGIIPVLSTGG